MAISTVKAIVTNRDTRTFHSNTLLRPFPVVRALLMLIIVATGAAAAAMPPVPYFSQCDSRWQSDQLGSDGPTICSMGCALTSAAMVMAYYGVDTDPKRLNNAIGRNGYDVNHCIKWPAVRNACHDEINQIEYSPGTVKPFDTTVLNTHIDSGHPVIVNVGGHFVVVTGRSDGTYYINDPISSAKSTLDDYPSRVRMHIYSGNPPDINKPLVGDWNGNGTDTTGIYNYTTANFSLDSGLNISFGISGDIPITGDWNGNGYDTIGVFRPSTAQFFLDYDNDGVSDMNATFGVIGDIPVVGDWDGDGDDNIGVFRPNHSDSGLTTFFLDLDNSGGSADQSVAFGEPDDLPVIGDWDGDGDDNIGLYRPGTTIGVFYLDIDNDGGSADIVTPEYGDLEDVPIAGDWDGDSDDNIGVYRPSTGKFFMDATVPDVLPSKTIYVDGDFDDEPSEHKWDTIQEGVDDADDGDTVVVYAGVYVENVNIYGQGRLTLIGEGTDVVTVTAASASADDDVFEVHADYVNISGFTVTGATQSSGVGAGICLFYAEHCNISNNNISNNSCGIYMEDTSNNTLRNNAISGNGWNFGVFGKSLSHHIHDIDTSNTVNGKPIYYWINQQNEQIPYDAGFVGVVNCTNIMVNDLTSTSVLFAYTEDSRIESVTASDNWIGIYLKESNNNILQSNNAFNNKCGIALSSSDNNILQSNNVSGYWCGVGIALENSNNNILRGNNASNNEYYGSGITIEDSNNNTLQSNNAFNNGFGIVLSSSNNNTLYHNNLIDNTQCNAYDTGTNQWDSGSEGNYWSDYNGTDPDGDGIGDDPHPIPGSGGSVDNYPLMQPWTDTPPQKGDLNGDDQITPADAAIALQLASGGSASFDPATLAAADVSGDGQVTALDALMILQAAAGAIEL